MTDTQWLTIEKQDSTLNVTASRNTGQGPRNGLVRITSAKSTNGAINIAIQQDVDSEIDDINGDGVVNAVDVHLVINAALGIEINL